MKDHATRVLSPMVARPSVPHLRLVFCTVTFLARLHHPQQRLDGKPREPLDITMFPQWLEPILFVAGYVALMRWVLPALGISTCMSGACRLPATTKPREHAAHSAKGSETHG
jgi:hypothetical protein